jgi:hypothetical protein
MAIERSLRVYGLWSHLPARPVRELLGGLEDVAGHASASPEIPIILGKQINNDNSG